MVDKRAGGESEYLFAASAIPADIGKQRHGAFPRQHYVDTLRRCRGCGRWLIFFALEQRHWYEVLEFGIDADCVHCHACRREDQRLRRAQRRYAARIADVTSIGDREFSTLLRDALFLTESGVIKSDAKLRRLRNVAVKRALSSETLRAVSAFLDDKPR